MSHCLSALTVLSLSLLAFQPTAVSAEEETDVNIGGAVRLNYNWKDYGDDDDGAFDFELFAVDVDVTRGNW